MSYFTSFVHLINIAEYNFVLALVVFPQSSSWIYHLREPGLTERLNLSMAQYLVLGRIKTALGLGRATKLVSGELK